MEGAEVRRVRELLRKKLGLRTLVLTHRNLRGVGLDYPRPETIGPDRLANAIAAQHLVGGPIVVVDFGTAVTFDIVDRRGRYVGGIIAPGLAAMTFLLVATIPHVQVHADFAAAAISLLVGIAYFGLILGGGRWLWAKRSASTAARAAAR